MKPHTVFSTGTKNCDIKGKKRMFLKFCHSDKTPKAIIILKGMVYFGSSFSKFPFTRSVGHIAFGPVWI